MYPAQSRTSLLCEFNWSLFYMVARSRCVWTEMPKWKNTNYLWISHFIIAL